ncbi:MAG: hypothetical protein WA001_00130 [Patescibacteria group bacterium]
MMPKSNPAARQLSSVPQTHRASTLRAIAQKAHDVTARVQFLNTEGEKIRQLLENIPEDSDSRLAWLNSQLHGSN